MDQKKKFGKLDALMLKIWDTFPFQAITSNQGFAKATHMVTTLMKFYIPQNGHDINFLLF